MGSTMEAFCCSNNNYDNELTNPHEQESSRKNPTKNTLRSSILGISKLPTNEINAYSNIYEVMDLKSIEDKKNYPFKDYTLIEKIGGRSYSEVFLVKYNKNNDIFSLKKIKRNKITNITDYELRNILDKLKQLNHAYVNKIQDYYKTNDYIYLLEEFCSEGNLEDKIKKMKMIPEFIVKIIMFEIFKALIYLNSKNLIHGDLKLENILIELNAIKMDKKKNNKDIEFEEDKFIKSINKDSILIYNHLLQNKTSNYKFDFKNIDSVKIINKKINESQRRSESSQMSTGLRFGAIKKGDNKLRAIPNLKYTGENNIYNSGKFEFLKYGIKLTDYNKEKFIKKEELNIDTISYLSPEAIKENTYLNNDIWSCGIIMYYLLSGNFPFIGNNIEEIKNKILLGKFIFDFDKFTGISEDAKDLIKKCLKVDKDLRIDLKDTVKHPFFDDLKDSGVYLIDEKKILENLKNQKERPMFYQMVLTFISYNFKDTELLMDLSRIFYKIDRNSDGKITKEDLTQAYEDAGEKIKKEELEQIIKLVDFDRNGNIEYDEFIRVCIPEDRLFTENNLKDAFDLFDKYKIGEISYLNVVEALEREDRINSKMIELLKIEVDQMGHETLNFEQFKNLMEKLSLQ